MDFYKKPDAATALEYARIIHEMEMRTCKVVSFQFTQVFRKSSPTTWNVVNDPDAGWASRPCSIVNLSRFEAKGTYSWDYYARKAITNPNGQSMGGKCGETFDEREYKYESGSNGRVLLVRLHQVQRALMRIATLALAAVAFATPAWAADDEKLPTWSRASELCAQTTGNWTLCRIRLAPDEELATYNAQSAMQWCANFSAKRWDSDECKEIRAYIKRRWGY
jgi:hypothetical protein